MTMVSAVEMADRLIQLVRENDDISNYSDGCAEAVRSAEVLLGLKFPPSYRRVVMEFGTWDVAGQEFLGVYQTPAMGNALLGSVTETLDARTQHGMPAELIAVMFDGMGGIFVLDTSESDSSGEYPVLIWNPGALDLESLERVGDDFGSFALDWCQQAVTAWRES